METMTNELLTRKQVCQLLQVCQSTVIRMEQAQQLHPIRIGRSGKCVRHLRSEIQALCQQSIPA